MTPDAQTTEVQTATPAAVPTRDVSADDVWRALSESDRAAIAREKTQRQQDLALARQVYMSGQFDECKLGPEKAVALFVTKLQLGRAINLNPMDSIKCIVFIQGKPSLENSVIQDRLYETGIAWEPEFTFEDGKTNTGRAWRRCTGVTLWLLRANRENGTWEPWLGRSGAQHSVTYGLADAEMAMLWEGGRKSEGGSQKPLSERATYQSFPQDMFYWKAVSRVRKYFAPGLFRASVVSTADAADFTVSGPPMQIEAALPETEGETPPAAAPAAPEPALAKPSLKDYMRQAEREMGREPGDGE